MIRERYRAGLPMRASDVHDAFLIDLAGWHFGGWYQAVRAARIQPEGKPHGRRQRPPDRLRRLTQSLLRGPLPSAQLEHLTGVWRQEVRRRRAELGIVRKERRRACAWLSQIKRLLGRVPDVELAERVGVRPMEIWRVRQALGIAAAPRRALCTGEVVLERLRHYRRATIERAIATLPRRQASVMRARVLAEPPVSLARIARRLGICLQSVRWHERRGLALLFAALESRQRARRGDRSPAPERSHRPRRSR